VPRLWCPTLTHFLAAGQIDANRIRRHMQVLSPYVKGLLVPGSTGEGWEMNDSDIQGLLSVVLDAARTEGIRVLVGVLKTEQRSMLACIQSTIQWVQSRSGAPDPLDAMTKSNIAGFTVCPPKGSDLSQGAIRSALAGILDLGIPVALYQLPQVTGNEMSPETLASLAADYPNFILFKDTSGQDRVAQSGRDFAGVFLVRGAEGQYAKWPRSAGGCYDGFLLSTANVFARELASILDLSTAGRHAEAGALAERVTQVVQHCFALVAQFPTGNAFTNANKLMDHAMAHGPAATQAAPPLLYSGTPLPAALVADAVQALDSAGFLPARGYLQEL
jgi:dihydrodipicolinate synthase/N-acetylneuraminate lyase